MNATYSKKYVAVGLAMLLAAGLTLAMTPTQRIAVNKEAIDLEKMIPKEFGEWKLDPTVVSLLVSPNLQATLDKTYNQILARTYVNHEGRRIMLSLAYGQDQSHSTQIHKPEVCYPAQGFSIISMAKDQVSTSSGNIASMRIVTRQGQRSEPVTYWIRVGDMVVRGAVEQNLARIRYGLKGYIPDGLLFRVSEISQDVSSSFALQDQFVDNLLSALRPTGRHALIGATS